MRSPAVALAWEFRQRHRWGLFAVTSYLVVLAAIRLLNLQPGDVESGRFAGLVSVPLTTTLMYLLAVFSFGITGDVAARESLYPARMFSLPVTTAALAGWPMLYGAAVVAILWLAARLFVQWPAGIDMPVIWPGLLAAALLAWTQALSWMPYGLRGLRVIVAVLSLASIDAVVLVAMHYKLRESLMEAFLSPQVPLAYLVARVAVARARRGDVPDWRGMFARLGRIADAAVRRRDGFASPARAQAWFEWRVHGRSLPALVGLLLPFELALLFLPGNHTPAFVIYTLLVVLLTPPGMAAFAATTVRQSNPQLRNSHGMTPFLATRPLTSGALVGAKLEMTIWSTLAAWLLVIVAIALALMLSATWPVVVERARQFIDGVGTLRAIVIVLLGLSALMASTWKQLVQSLYIGLTGREWAVKASVVLTLSFLFAIGPIVEWIRDDWAVVAALWDALRWIPAVLVCVKITAAAWIATRLCRSRLLSDRALVTGAACWLVVVLALYAVLVWLVATPFIPRYLLALVAILAVPLARVSAAPLALAWNRHR